jgi:NTE family protein
MMFLVVDAGLGPRGDWVRTIEGPSGAALVNAITDAAMDSSKRASYTAFERTMQEWRDALVRWRCGAEGARLRAAHGGPNCSDVRFLIGRLSFEQLGLERAAELNAVPTSLKLPPESVDALIDAGRDALRTSTAYKTFLGSY